MKAKINLKGPVRAVVFDMDGVLVDSETIWHQVRSEYAAEFGQTWTQADQISMLGCSMPDWSERMRVRLQITSITASDLAEDVIARVQQAFRRGLPQRPGAFKALRSLAEQYPLALASGSPRVLVNSAMNQTGMGVYFQAITCGDDVKYGKPNPEIYLRSLECLRLAPEHAVGIEDAPNGLRALRSAGMWAIAAPCPEFPLDNQSLSLAHAKVTSLEHLSTNLVDSIGTSI